MGGINHQPCRFYDVESTTLSKLVTEGFTALLRANSHLEDAILSELTKNPRYLPQVESAWEQSLAGIEESGEILTRIQSALEVLETRMETIGFQDSELMPAMDMDALRNQWQKHGVTSPCPQWEEVVSLLRAGGFRAVFQRFREAFGEIAGRNEEMIQTFNHLREPARAGSLHVTIEKGREFRETFNRLLTAWLDGLRTFQISALISNEIHFLTCECIPEEQRAEALRSATVVAAQ